MKKLTKAQAVIKADLVERADAEFMALDAAISAYNAAVALAYAELAPKVASYNAYMQECAEWRDEVKQDLEEYVENRSEKWQESDTATAYSNWLGELQIDFDTVEIDEPEEVEFNPENYEEIISQIAESIDDYLG